MGDVGALALVCDNALFAPFPPDGLILLSRQETPRQPCDKPSNDDAPSVRRINLGLTTSLGILLNVQPVSPSCLLPDTNAQLFCIYEGLDSSFVARLQPSFKRA